MKGELVKNRELALVSISWFSLKNDNLDFKMKIVKFRGIQPILRMRQIILRQYNTTVFIKCKNWEFYKSNIG